MAERKWPNVPRETEIRNRPATKPVGYFECENCGKFSMVDAIIKSPTNDTLAVGFFCHECGIFIRSQEGKA